MESPQNLFAYRKYWAKRFGTAPILPTCRAEMDQLGWDSCDIILITGDAYVDHPSFGMALIGRVLENQGFRVGIISQPDWNDPESFRALGSPNLFFGVTSGNMDSMVNHYTADRKIRSDDAYTPAGISGKRPDRAVIIYTQACRKAYKDVPVVIGGIEASLRRISHYDYWSEKIRRSILFDAKADILVYGNGERQIVEIAHRLASGEKIANLQDIRGTAVILKQLPDDHVVIDSTDINASHVRLPDGNPYADREVPCDVGDASSGKPRNEIGLTELVTTSSRSKKGIVLLPAFESVRDDTDLYVHASRVFHLETNPFNARPIAQAHGDRFIFINPPALPMSTAELDRIFELPYQRTPHPVYQNAKIPAYEMIRFSVNIMRGCFGGCTFCSITEHEGRIIQNRSEKSILHEIETIRDTTPGFTGVISDLGGPTANMYRLACKSPEIESACRRLSCVYPEICKNLGTSHKPLIQLYRKARDIPGIKKILIASGLRYDLAVKDPEYIKELATYHVGGYLKIAPEHTESGPLSKMMKPGIGAYYEFKQLFDKFSREAGKEQYLIPYFIAAHPGTTDEDMLALALWLKENNYRADQVQTFLPSPMALATAMYHSGKNPLVSVKRSEKIPIPRGMKTRKLHKAFLRYHDPDNWPLLRDALKRMGRADLIGNGKRHLIPKWQPVKAHDGPVKKKRAGKFMTQHTR